MTKFSRHDLKKPRCRECIFFHKPVNHKKTTWRWIDESKGTFQEIKINNYSPAYCDNPTRKTTTKHICASRASCFQFEPKEWF